MHTENILVKFVSFCWFWCVANATCIIYAFLSYFHHLFHFKKIVPFPTRECECIFKFCLPRNLQLCFIEASISLFCFIQGEICTQMKNKNKNMRFWIRTISSCPIQLDGYKIYKKVYTAMYFYDHMTDSANFKYYSSLLKLLEPEKVCKISR